MPDMSETLALGLQYHQAGYLSHAEQLYRQVLQTDSANADALAYLGELCMAQGRFAEAAAAFQQALELRPKLAELQNSLGVALAQQGKTVEAAAHFQQALEVKPEYPEAHNNLGIVLEQQGILDAALTQYSQALALRPDYAEAHNNLGIVLARERRLDEAVASYREAIRLKPDYAEAHNNLGAALELRGQLQEAVSSYGQAVRLKPDYAEAHNNLGASLDALRNLEEALASYGEAVRLKPDYAEAHRNRALLWLLLGDFEQGWPEYEWRWWCRELTLPQLRQPLWDGSPLQGRAILLHAEQGLGDTLQFIRYALLVQQRGGHVLVRCQPPLLALLASCPGIDDLAAQGTLLPEFDVHLPLLSVPRVLGTTLATIPAQVPYLSAEAELVERWQQELAALCPPAQEGRSLKVGIAWQGNPEHKQDQRRSIPLEQFECLAGLAGVRLLSLQVGPGAEQLRELGKRFPVLDLASRFDPLSFRDAAAAMRALDLVITVDSAVAHLAGALAVPVWTLLAYAADWRWLLGREDSPWYPTMRLFRQKEPGNWHEVFDRIAHELARRRGGKAWPRGEDER